MTMQERGPHNEPELSPGVNPQTGTTYTVQSSDRDKLITFSNSSPVAVTVPQAVAAFGSGFEFKVLNLGAGTVTLTPATSTVNGSSTLVLTTNQGADFYSDGTNWEASSSGISASVLGFSVVQTKQSIGSAPNITTETTLFGSFDPFPAGALNTVNKRMVIKGSAFFTTAVSETPTITLSILFATISVASVTTGAVTASLTNSPFNFEFILTTNATGASGALIRSARVEIDLTGTGLFVGYGSIPATPSNAVNLTGTSIPFLRIAASGNLTAVAVNEIMVTVI